MLLKQSSKNDAEMSIALTRNPDILAGVSALSSKRPFTVGFAAETNDMAAHARGKLERKKLDMIAANVVGRGLGFDVDTNALTVFWADGQADIATAPKEEVAHALWRLIQKRRALS